MQNQVADLEDDIPQLQQEVEELQDQLADLEYDLTHAMEELVDSQEAISNMSRQLNQVLLERDDVVNAGKAYDGVGPKQKSKSWLNSKEQLMLLFGLVSPLVLYQHS